VPPGLPGRAVTRVGHVIYLHGFASSPESSKAQRFGRELAACGVSFECPDLNQPAFETLTVTRMLERVHRAIAGAPAHPVALIGSSLGAFVALHATGADRLILLAPAVDFGGHRLTRFGKYSLDEWRQAGRVSVFHYGQNRWADIDFILYEDAARYDAFSAPANVPTLVFHGRADDTVDPASVERWADGRPGVDLRMVDDDHQLSRSVDLIWAESRKFLGLR
jgi:uncharacterized protein